RLASDDTHTRALVPLSLHDALPISWSRAPRVLAIHDSNVDRLGLLGFVRMLVARIDAQIAELLAAKRAARQHALDRLLDDALRKDRKSTRLNSSHVKSSYAVFCLKK